MNRYRQNYTPEAPTQPSTLRVWLTAAVTVATIYALTWVAFAI